MIKMTKVLVIGLDGGTWNIIEPLVKEGKLPTIAKLMEEGVHGDLESAIPHITFPAWKCYSTGKNPGKLGVYWFTGVDIEKQKIIFNNSTSFKSKELWDYLSANNMVCGILDMPTTYPPKKINGFMVSGEAPTKSKYTYPESLEKELKDKFDYKINPEHPAGVDMDLHILDTKEVIKQRFVVAKYLLEKFKPAFFHVTIFHIDGIQHFFWKYMEKKDVKYGKVIEDSWKLIDDGIKTLLEEFGDEKIYVVLMSDHGFTSVKGTFQISQWLIEKRYLILKNRRLVLPSIIPKLGLNRDRMFLITNKLRIASLIRGITSRERRQKILGRFFPPGADVVDRNPLESLIDWEKSKVIPIPQGPLYINTNVIAPGREYEMFRNKLIEEIRSIENPENGEKLAKGVYKKEEIYTGKYVYRAPDIVILPNEGHEIATAASSKDMWDFSRRQWSGCHRLHGIFVVNGPGVKKGVKIMDTRIIDLAPTLLHIFDLPIPKDVDGRVLKELFEEDSELVKREIKYQEEEGEKEKIMERIRELKKIDKI